ncbi:hypothetical protein RRG08_037548 [Elysia crispata]|uniref:Uncharacterized protein n=1 Tax=Elysia crispata TaxID=231223 RepID=A0AAE0Y6D6_9GAST|nr:hypothetical protein RRG08_037548 [Elysia crispata]
MFHDDLGLNLPRSGCCCFASYRKPNPGKTEQCITKSFCCMFPGVRSFPWQNLIVLFMSEGCPLIGQPHFLSEVDGCRASPRRQEFNVRNLLQDVINFKRSFPMPVLSSFVRYSQMSLQEVQMVTVKEAYKSTTIIYYGAYGGPNHACLLRGVVMQSGHSAVQLSVGSSGHQFWLYLIFFLISAPFWKSSQTKTNPDDFRSQSTKSKHTSSHSHKIRRQERLSRNSQPHLPATGPSHNSKPQLTVTQTWLAPDKSRDGPRAQVIQDEGHPGTARADPTGDQGQNLDHRLQRMIKSVSVTAVYSTRIRSPDDITAVGRRLY